VKAPRADVVTVAGTVVTLTPLNLIVMVEEEAKLAPVTVTIVPSGPWMGDTLIMEVVTVKVAEAVSAGTVPTSLPERTTAYGPDAMDGTVNVHVKVPVAEVVFVVQVCTLGVAPLNVIVPIAVDTEKPEPATVTEVPMRPWLGDKVIVGVVTVKVAEAVSAGTVPTSLPERTTAYGPDAMDGTVNVHVKVPVAEVVWDVQVCPLGVAPLNVIVLMVVETENPEPVTVTEVPIGPWITVRVIMGVVTVKVAEAVSAGTVPISLPETIVV